MKPKTPTNVTIDSSEKEYLLVNWNNGYLSSSNLKDKLIYEIKITSKQDPKELRNRVLNQVESHYKIYKRELKKGSDYMINIRSEPSRNYNGTWSDWSPTVEWHNDYSPADNVSMKVFLPISCIAILVFILLIYGCISFFKKKWWNNIPDPAKSKLALQKLQISKGSASKPGMNSNVILLTSKNKKAKRTCSYWLLSWLFKSQAHTDTSNQLLKKHNYDGYRNLCENNDHQILTPEMTHIERHIEMQPLKANEKNLSLDTNEDDKQEDDLNSLDLTINKMFADILENSACKTESNLMMMMKKLEYYKNENVNLDGFSFFPDNLHEDFCGSESKNDKSWQTHEINDGYKLFSPDEWSKSQQSYTQKAEVIHSFSEDLSMTNTFVDSDYSRFDSAIASSENKITCINNMTDSDSAMSVCSEEYPSKGNTSSLPWYPKNNSFYKTNSCLSLKENIGFQVICNNNENDIKIQYKELGSYPTFTHNTFQYQSFSKVIQQGKECVDDPVKITDYNMQEPGYKSFESLITQNRESSEVENCNQPIELHWNESCDSCMENLRAEFNSSDNKINRENDTQHELYSGFLKTESCLDNGCKSLTMEKSHPSKDSSNPNNNDIRESNIKKSSAIKLQDQDITDNSFALTFDIAEHMRNLEDTKGINHFDKISSKNSKMDAIVEGSFSGCPVGNKPSLSKALLASIQSELYFDDYPNALKFENMSYFPLYQPETIVLLRDIETNSSEAKNHSIMEHKSPDEDDNLYMTVTLLQSPLV
ncbi:uncharacterized protein LOC128641805 isoform X2 [Bombina bombina]|uniref:uncharacterized protein LOC128641805 isoform X2 n=1 Tax=Bombina bombina TaxID=8345 RepID=UPI00235A9845|nr:uncharacterized protein LOC128641805 isoform X2 [Bombina bombina]